MGPGLAHRLEAAIPQRHDLAGRPDQLRPGQGRVRPRCRGAGARSAQMDERGRSHHAPGVVFGRLPDHHPSDTALTAAPVAGAELSGAGELGRQQCLDLVGQPSPATGRAGPPRPAPHRPACPRSRARHSRPGRASPAAARPNRRSGPPPPPPGQAHPSMLAAAVANSRPKSAARAAAASVGHAACARRPRRTRRCSAATARSAGSPRPGGRSARPAGTSRRRRPRSRRSGCWCRGRNAGGQRSCSSSRSNRHGASSSFSPTARSRMAACSAVEPRLAGLDRHDPHDRHAAPGHQPAAPGARHPLHQRGEILVGLAQAHGLGDGQVDSPTPRARASSSSIARTSSSRRTDTGIMAATLGDLVVVVRMPHM